MKIIAVSNFQRRGLRDVLETIFPACVAFVPFDDLDRDRRSCLVDEIAEADLVVLDIRADDRKTSWIAGVCASTHCPVLVFGDTFQATVHPVADVSIGAFYRLPELEKALRKVADALTKGPAEFASVSTELRLQSQGQG